MIDNTVSIPWTCHICRLKFDTPSGGICNRCNNVTCSKHLRHIVIEEDLVDKEGTRLVCENCICEGETTESVTKWKWRVRFSK